MKLMDRNHGQDRDRAVSARREKASFGAMLAAVLVLGGSVASWAQSNVCQKVVPLNVTSTGKCSTGFLSCSSTPPQYTGGCAAGGTLPCSQLPYSPAIQYQQCQTTSNVSGSCTTNETTHVTTCTVTVNGGVSCAAATLTMLQGQAQPQTTPPCTPPG